MHISSRVGQLGLALLAVACGAPRPLEHTTTRVEPLTWAVQQIDDPPNAQYDLFGYGLAVSRDTALLGALELSLTPGMAHGATYAYTRQVSVWKQQGPALTADDGIDYDNFGQRIALDGDMALIGAYYKSVAGAKPFGGGVYVFTRTADTWSQQGPAFAPTNATGFGASISISGNTALIGADFSNNVFTYIRNGNAWTQQGSAFAGSDTTSGDEFGFSVALVGDTALVGAFQHNVGSVTRQGSAYVFTRSGTTWTQQAEFTTSVGELDEGFGVSVALSADASTAVVGADGVNGAQGAAYVYTRSGTTWAEQGAPLTAPTPVANDHFGESVAIQGETIWVAASGGHGAVYRFTRSAGVWSEQAPVLTAPISAPFADFGRSMVAAGNTVWVSDPYARANAGEEYVFSLDVGNPCGTASDCQSGYCSDGVCCNSACDGNCDVCSAALGAVVDGTCTVAAAAYAGRPICASSCDGQSASCPIVGTAGGAGGDSGEAGEPGAGGNGDEAGAPSGGKPGNQAGATSSGGKPGNEAGAASAGDSNSEGGAISTTTGGSAGGAVGAPDAGRVGGSSGSSGSTSSSSGGSAPTDDATCGCRLVGQRSPSVPAWLALGLLGLGVCRRSKRAKRVKRASAAR